MMEDICAVCLLMLHFTMYFYSNYIIESCKLASYADASIANSKYALGIQNFDINSTAISSSSPAKDEYLSPRRFGAP